ncbi:MAG TPA: beta-xylosidase [Candidatus Didemnitutus sp.]|nr:beta-xylosidase [Candidatus Didemnitutus sp.]
MKQLTFVLLALISHRVFAADPAPAFPVNINIDAARSLGELRPIWRYFGADEPNYATMKDGQHLLSDLGKLSPGHVYFRAHNLLTSGDGTPALKWGSTNAYTEDANGHPVYDWRGIDRIFDSYLARGVKPLVQIGFMPEALSSEPQPYRHEWRPGLPYSLIFTGWTKPPKDYAKWGELAYQWAKHSVEKYGAAEVSTWWWEVWNEANNQPKGYWGGSAEDFRKLHDYAVAGVRRALPTARVGGPHTAGSGGEFMKDFLDHCLHGTNYATGEKGTPLDYVAFHAKGSPTIVNGHVRMGISAQLKTIETAFTMIGSYPELKSTPVIIGESDPEGCAACQGPQLAYRNGTVYSSYTAAVFARKHDLAARHGINLEGAVTWAFTFEDQPYFAGFRQLASNGLPLAVLNVFRMYALMGPERIHAYSSQEIPLVTMIDEGVREEPDVAALASRGAKSIAVMVWHYHDDDVPGPDAAVHFTVAGLPANLSTTKLTHYRIDQNHSNPYGEWLRMGSPIAPDPKQYAALQKASDLATLSDAPAFLNVTSGKATLDFTLPRQGVSLLVIDWE